MVLFSVSRGSPRVHAIQRTVVFLAAALAVANPVFAAPVPISAQEVQLKTPRAGTLCILGVRVTYPNAKSASKNRLRIEVKRRNSRWERAKRDPILRIKSAKKNTRSVVHQPTAKRLFRYAIVNGNGKRISALRVVRLSALPLCPAVEDGDIIEQRDSGGSSSRDVPPPTDARGSSDTPITPPTCSGEAQLKAAWGTSEPACDLNGDGIVNGTDLAIFLGSESAPPVPVCNTTPQLLAAWGQSGGACDLDSNGTVDAADLALVLSSQATEP